MSELVAARTKVAFDPMTQPLMAILAPSFAAGDIAKAVTDQLDRLAVNLSPTLTRSEPMQGGAPSVAEQLHDALARAKILLSQVSMHLDKVWRDRLFHQLDALLDLDSWDEADEVLDQSSFSTFLRTILHLNIKRRPALGISYRGHILADWTFDGESLTMEFLPKDEVRWVLMHSVDGERESAAGQTQVGRLGAVLGPYDPARWFANAD